MRPCVHEGKVRPCVHERKMHPCVNDENEFYKNQVFMKVLFLQCSNDEAVVHSILYTKPNWSFYFRITSSKMIRSIISY